MLHFKIESWGDFVREKREGGRGRRRERQRVCENKQTYLLCFLKKKERGRENRRGRSKRDASSPLYKGL
jgi:hypothetical protein